MTIRVSCSAAGSDEAFCIRWGFRKTAHLAPNMTDVSDCCFSSFSSCFSIYTCKVPAHETTWKAFKCALIQGMTILCISSERATILKSGTMDQTVSCMLQLVKTNRALDSSRANKRFKKEKKKDK